MDLVALTPPFIYHWQCASVLLSAYIPVFIYTYVFQFGYPIMLVLFSFVKYTTLPVWMRAKVPGTLHRVLHIIVLLSCCVNLQYSVLVCCLNVVSSWCWYAAGIVWPDNWLQDGPEVFTPEEVAANKYIIARPKRLLNTKTVISYFANAAVILLTFGLCSPFLALAIIASTVLTSAVWLMFVGRFMHYRVYGLPTYEDQAMIALELQVAEAIGMIKVCVWPIVVSSCLFFAFLCWDMAGDEVGVTKALYIPIIAISMPVLIWGCIHVFEWQTQQKVFNLRTRKRSGSLVTRLTRGSSFVKSMVEFRNTFTSTTDAGSDVTGDANGAPPGVDQSHSPQSSPSSQSQSRKSLATRRSGSSSNSRFSFFSSSRETIMSEESGISISCTSRGSNDKSDQALRQSAAGSGIVSPLHAPSSPPSRHDSRSASVQSSGSGGTRLSSVI